MLKHQINIKKILFSAIVLATLLCAGPPALAASPLDSGTCANTSVNNTNKIDQTKVKNCTTQTPIVKDIQSIVNFLSIGVGVIVIIMIIVGGVQYSLAGDSPDATGKAKARITNALIALVAYLFIFSFLQWIIPGGLFG
jgi:hypothetical protein